MDDKRGEIIAQSAISLSRVIRDLNAAGFKSVAKRLKPLLRELDAMLNN